MAPEYHAVPEISGEISCFTTLYYYLILCLYLPKNIMVYSKGWVKKNLTKWNFVFAISQLIHHQNLKNLVPTLHNTIVIIWGRDKNFRVSMMYELRNRENAGLLFLLKQYQLSEFFWQEHSQRVVKNKNELVLFGFYILDYFCC